MEEKQKVTCSNCHFEYDPIKHAFCPNCNEGKEVKNPLIRLSEISVTMPFGGKLAVLLTSCYAVFRLIEMTTHLILLGAFCVAIYLGGIYFWFQIKDNYERPMWFLILLSVIYIPVVLLIILLIA